MSGMKPPTFDMILLSAAIYWLSDNNMFYSEKTGKITLTLEAVVLGYVCMCLSGLPVVFLLVFCVGGLFQVSRSGNITPTHIHVHRMNEKERQRENWESHQRSTAEG